MLSARHQDALERLAGELDSARVVVADLSLPQNVERLADEAGVDIKTARNIVNGKATRVDLETIGRIAEALGVEPGPLWRPLLWQSGPVPIPHKSCRTDLGTAPAARRVPFV